MAPGGVAPGRPGRLTRTCCGRRRLRAFAAEVLSVRPSDPLPITSDVNHVRGGPWKGAGGQHRARPRPGTITAVLAGPAALPTSHPARRSVRSLTARTAATPNGGGAAAIGPVRASTPRAGRRPRSSGARRAGAPARSTPAHRRSVARAPVTGRPPAPAAALTTAC